ncbi:MAG: oligosaccharide flippase family protein, partial [Chloroflexi bacterium]|nr:oligosaccharide flippase family protein [Chloroflexota bacterium]
MTAPADTSPLPAQPMAARTDRRIVLNTGALAASSLWRIGISFVLQLVIARLLGAQGLGQYATALAWLNVCQVLSELGLPQLLVRDLARHPERRRRAFQTALFAQIVAAFLIWAGVFGLTAILPYQSETRNALLLITASLPLFAVTSVCEMLFQANERMELVMGVEVAINSLIVGASLVVLWQGGGVVALSAVIIATQTISAFVCLWLVGRGQLLGAPDNRARESISAGLFHLWGLARPFYGLALANVLLHRLDILLLSVFAGETVTGIYSAAYLIVRVLIILAQTWWQSLYPTFSRLRVQAEEQYRRLAALSIRFGMMAFLPAAALSGGAADWLLGVVYRGEDHSAALAAYGVLIWAAPLFLIATYAVNLLLVERQPRGSLLIAGTHIAVVLALLPVLTAHWQALGAAVAMVTAISASALMGLLLLKRAAVPAGLPQR